MDELWRDEEKRENEKKWKNGRKKRERNYCDGWSLYGLAYRLSSRVNEWTSTHSTSKSIMVATKSTSKDPRHLFFFCVCVQLSMCAVRIAATLVVHYRGRIRPMKENARPAVSASHTVNSIHIFPTFFRCWKEENKSFPLEYKTYIYFFIFFLFDSLRRHSFTSTSLNFLFFYLYKATKQDFQE